MSSSEENKRIARLWLDLVSQHRVEEICAMTAPTWTMRGGPPKLSPGPDGVRELFATMGQVQQEWTIEEVIAEGDLVVVRAINRCTQDSFFGIPGQGREQVFSAMFMFRIVDGIVQEVWRNADDLGRLFQLGARLQPPVAVRSN